MQRCVILVDTEVKIWILLWKESLCGWCCFVDVVLGLDAEKCDKKINCPMCVKWIWLCSGRKNDRLKDFVELAKVVRKEAILEHA